MKALARVVRKEDSKSLPMSYLLMRLNGERNSLNAALVTALSLLGKTRKRCHPNSGAASLAALAKRQYGGGC